MTLTTILGAVGPIEITLILIVLLLLAFLPILALIDIVKSRFEGNTKLMWVIIVIFANIFGSILYFTIGKKQKI
jgi:hypothetical protein